MMKFNKWKNALERFADHESSKHHCDSVLKAECTLSIESGKQDSVAVQLNHQAKQQILDNRRKITPIIETDLLRQTRNSFERTSGQRSAFFRGSRIRRYQRWKFRALIRYRGKYDEVFKNGITSAGRNAQYLSPRVHNEILSACNDLILERLVDYIGRCSFFYSFG